MEPELALVAMTTSHRQHYEAWLATRGLKIGRMPLPPSNDRVAGVGLYLVTPADSQSFPPGQDT